MTAEQRLRLAKALYFRTVEKPGGSMGILKLKTYYLIHSKFYSQQLMTVTFCVHVPRMYRFYLILYTFFNMKVSLTLLATTIKTPFTFASDVSKNR